MGLTARLTGQLYVILYIFIHRQPVANMCDKEEKNAQKTNYLQSVLYDTAIHN